MTDSEFARIQSWNARRRFLISSGIGLGGMALSQMMGDAVGEEPQSLDIRGGGGELKAFHHLPKAKRVIYLFMSGGPSHLDLLDYKPLLKEKEGEQLPDSVRGSQRLTGMSGNQSSIPLVGSPFRFEQSGESGAWFSELLPHTAGIADKICVLHPLLPKRLITDPALPFSKRGPKLQDAPASVHGLVMGWGKSTRTYPPSLYW